MVVTVLLELLQPCEAKVVVTMLGRCGCYSSGGVVARRRWL